MPKFLHTFFEIVDFRSFKKRDTSINIEHISYFYEVCSKQYEVERTFCGVVMSNGSLINLDCDIDQLVDRLIEIENESKDEAEDD